MARRRPPVVDKIPSMKMSQLMRLWNNAARLSKDRKTAKKGEPTDAVIVLREIEKEWKRRGARPPRPEEFFEWPNSDAYGGDGRLSASGWVVEGLLSYMGYRVGSTNGLSSDVRCRILELIFEGELPPVFEPAYLKEWGSPGSARRLQKMAETLAAFSRNAKRKKSAQMGSAIKSWDQDLLFLYENFYIDRFYFAWPSNRIDLFS